MNFHEKNYKLESLISADEIAIRLPDVGAQITQRLQGHHVLAVPVMNGALMFAADVLRYVDWPLRVCGVRAKSYVGETTQASQDVSLEQMDEALELAKGKTVLILDDILDTGCTLAALKEAFLNAGADVVVIAVLLHKESVQECQIEADIVAFDIPDRFVVGYGLDYDGYFRHLPYVAELETM